MVLVIATSDPVEIQIQSALAKQLGNNPRRRNDHVEVNAITRGHTPGRDQQLDQTEVGLFDRGTIEDTWQPTLKQSERVITQQSDIPDGGLGRKSKNGRWSLGNLRHIYNFPRKNG
jgi:hypothetical protein